MKKVSLLKASASVLVALSTSAYAQEEVELDTVVVSGGFTPIESTRYGGSSSVVTAQDIEDRNLNTVQDALRGLPGVAVSSTGTNFTQVTIRGGRANHVKILVDGIAISGSDEGYNLSTLDTANIERIEVLRGPQSVFYGASASSGVINIITKKGGQGTQFGGHVQVGDGYGVSARASHRTDRGGFALNLARLDDNGYDFSNSDGEKDDTQRNTVQLSGDYKLTEQFKVGFNAWGFNERYAFDSTNSFATTPEDYVVDDTIPRAKREDRLGQVFAEYEALGGALLHRLEHNYTDTDQTFFSAFDPFNSKSERRRTRYLISYGMDGRDVSSTNHLVNGILEYEKQTLSTTFAAETQRRTKSIALEYRGQLANGLDLQGGLRYDDNDSFENFVTGILGASYTLASGVRLHGQAGTGVVDPTVSQLLGDGLGTQGNPNLKPEQNQSIDFGAEVPFMGGRGIVDATVFFADFVDKIERVSVGGTPTYANADTKERNRGLELTGAFAATDTLDLTLNYTYLRAKNADGSVSVRNPKHQLLLGATQQIFQGRGNVTANLRYVSEQYDNVFFAGPAPVAELDDFVTVDVSANYSLSDTVELTGRITNLFDETYEEGLGYVARDRTFYTGLRAEF